MPASLHRSRAEFAIHSSQLKQPNRLASRDNGLLMKRHAPLSRGDPLREVVASRAARFAQENSAVCREMLAPERLEMFPLGPLIENVGAKDQIESLCESR